ncbi:hypothetical protein A3K78_03640 [Candidatus Bathyarchaeota archaeon RBG_13_52_12]|nr:MAG: hypothetical protein A3K78_03640 [Candidatus Bathyarchaeota archaeon RBG_13_52_12]
MNNINENKKKVVQILNSYEYEIDEVEGAILASKYCERSGGGLMCLLLEATPPFDEIKTWGEYAADLDDSDIKNVLNSLNENLFELLGGARVLQVK